jgi:two-component system cell cycle sensor histidine kinase/response regulator CckA
VDPIASAAFTTEGVSLATVRGANRLCVLVVDDDAGLRHFLRSSLRGDGFDALTASCLDDAVSLYAGVVLRVNVALIDVMMPGGDGPVVLRALRQTRPDLPVVFMSGELDHECSNDLASRLRDDRPNGLIAKPFSLTVLSSLLREVAIGAPVDHSGPPHASADSGQSASSA